MSRKLFAVIALLIAIIFSGFPFTGMNTAYAAVQAVYYVSASGSDSNPGTLSQPFATITKARDVVRTINGNMTGDIYVYIMQGDYFIDKPVEFSSADSGTNGYNIYYKNHNAIGSARFIGGQQVTGWSQYSGNIYRVNVGTGQNLASGCTVSASSYQAGNEPGKGNDGIGTTRWAASSSAMPQWWKVDLGSLQTVNSTEIDFYDPSGRYYGYKIEVSADDTTYRLVMDKSSNTAKGNTLKDYFDPVSARYVRITVTGTSETGGFACFYEARVYSRWVFNTLYENGKRAVKARYPNYEYDSRYPTSKASYLYSQGVSGSHTELQYADGELNPAGWNLNDAQVFIWPGGYNNWAWYTDIVPISSINTSTRVITLKQDTRYIVHNSGSSSRYFVQGVLQLLDRPGEFHLDTSTGYLYYWARDGAIASQTIIAPKVRRIISVTGQSESDRVHNIQFEGLTFDSTEFSEWYRHAWVNDGESGEGHTYYQYDRQMTMPQHRIGTIFMQNTDHITVKNCHVKNGGYSGIYMLFYNQYNTVYGNWMEHLGRAGVLLEGKYPGEGDVLKYNIISNNRIHNVGDSVGDASGIYIMNCSNNQVSYSEIYNSPRYGIGWIGYTDMPYSAMYLHDNTFRYLKLFNGCQDSGDTGFLNTFGITNDYTTTPYYSNTVEQVTIDNVYAHPSMNDYSPNGIFTDENTGHQIFTNVKVTNAQFGQYRDNNGQAPNHTFSNVTWSGTFNEALMDYSNIGLKADFPSEYRKGVIADSFENSYESGFENWFTGKGRASRSTARAHSGSYSYVTDEDMDVIYQASNALNYNKVAVVWFYDDASDTSLASMARVDNGAWNDSYSWRGLGVDTDISATKYVYRVGITETATNITRTTGWHRLVWDYRSGSGLDMYIDGTLVASPAGNTSFSRIAMGNWWGGIFAGTVYFDDFVVQDTLP